MKTNILRGLKTDDLPGESGYIEPPFHANFGGGHVHIGVNCWIGAGSVVTEDLPSNVVAVGNPCRILREVNAHDREYYFKDRKIDPAILGDL